uniref:Immunoglobulin V-set domain-containing protein n=1 Tax=Amphilophus citrinellus TaxID=61819 RepID=A0A3Q0R0Z6_AMPCI
NECCKKLMWKALVFRLTFSPHRLITAKILPELTGGSATSCPPLDTSLVKHIASYKVPVSHPSFHGRVKLRNPEMKDGDVSLILENVTFNDTGIYECHIAVKNPGSSKRAHTEISHFINLTVTGECVELTLRSSFLFLLLLLLLLSLLLCCTGELAKIRSNIQTSLLRRTRII